MRKWRALIAETVTGTVVADVAISGEPGFTRAINDKGEWSVSLVIDDEANRGVDFRVYVRPAWYSWAVLYGSYVVQAGPVWTHSFDEENRALSVSGSGMAGLFDRRVVRNPNGDPSNIAHNGNDVAYTGLSLRGIMRQLVADNMAQSGYDLPIDLPPTEVGTNERNYYGYELATLWDRITKLSEVINGPEFDFAPVLSPDHTMLRWRLDIGNPMLGDQETEAVWDYGGALSMIDTDVDGSEAPITRAWVKGSGDDEAMISGYATNPDALANGYPGLDHVNGDHTSVTEQSTVDEYALADLDELRAAKETWSCTVRIDGMTTKGVEVSPGLGSWALGDAPIFGVSGHPWIPDGNYRKRIMSYSPGDVATVALELSAGYYVT